MNMEKVQTKSRLWNSPKETIRKALASFMGYEIVEEKGSSFYRFKRPNDNLCLFSQSRAFEYDKYDLPLLEILDKIESRDFEYSIQTRLEKTKLYTFRINFTNAGGYFITASAETRHQAIYEALVHFVDGYYHDMFVDPLNTTELNNFLLANHGE
jgi:hypothetical protein